MIFTKKMKTTKQLLLISGLAFMIWFSLVLMWIFTVAYIDPSKQVLVNINSIGEAKIELFIFILSIPFIIYALKSLIKFK